MVTPFGPDGDLDLDAARSLARHLVANGSEGLVLAGTTGEAPTVNDVERVQLIEAVVDEVGDRASVIATTGTYDTRALGAPDARGSARPAPTPSWSSRRTTTSRPRRASTATSRAIAEAPADDRRSSSTTSRSASSSTCGPSCSRASREIDNVMRRQAGHHRHRPGAGHRRRAGSRSTPATTTCCCRSARSAAAAASASPRTSSATTCWRWSRPATRATSSAPARSTPSCAALRRRSRSPQPDPGQGRGRAARASRSASLRLPLVAATDAERAVVRAALERRGLLAARMTAPGVRIIPLGGMGEIGKNMTVVEQDASASS